MPKKITSEWSHITHSDIEFLMGLLPKYKSPENVGWLMPIENQNRIAWMFRNSLYRFRKGKTGKLIIRKGKNFDYDLEQYMKFKN